MGRYRYRRNWSYYGNYVVSKRQELSSTFGGIDRDVEGLFLNLSRPDLEELFEVYQESFGRSAASYARKTYQNWKKGNVRMSGQVAERLLNLLPPLLPDNIRYELVKKLRSANFRRVQRAVHTTPAEWREALAPVVREVVEHGQSAAISNAIKERVAWLAEGDVAAAERLLHAAEQDEALIRLSYLTSEFKRIDAMVLSMGALKTSISHEIDLPQGSISVFIQPPKISTWQRFTNWMG
jgi:hypothetical protein